MRQQSLHTVCESARCPNVGECWSHRTATFMILGELCTRRCGFCAVPKGKPNGEADEAEPERVADAACPRVLALHLAQQVGRQHLGAVDAAAAGDIVGLFGVDCHTGDTFVGPGPRLAMTSMHVPAAVISLAVQPKDRAGEVKEDQYLHPTTMYGCNKLYCEHLGRYYQQNYKQLAAEPLSGKEILLRVAAVMGRRPILLEVPLVTPRLSSHWIRLVTRADYKLARELVERKDDVRVETVERDRSTVLELSVSPDDLGRVIGRGGRTAKAFRTVLDEAELQALAARIKKAGHVAVDTETTSPQPTRARLVGLSFSIEPAEAFYVPVGHDYLGAPAQKNISPFISHGGHDAP